MAINVFAGARRLAAIVGGAWLIGALYMLAFPSPLVSLSYSIEGVGLGPVLTDASTDCRTDDAVEYETRPVEGVGKVLVFLCFRSYERRIPYALRRPLIPQSPQEFAKVDDRVASAIRSQGGTPLDYNQYLRTAGALSGPSYSPEVASYLRTASAAFQIDAAGAERARSQYRDSAKASRLETAKFSGIGLAISWIVIAAIGWIVRGFLGIPRGQDSRNPPTTPSL